MRPQGGVTPVGSSVPSARTTTSPSRSRDRATMVLSALGVALTRTSRSIAIETTKPSW
jgi:hypothetical protein